MINAPEEYKDKAWQRLIKQKLKQKLDFPSFAKIIKEVPKIYKDKAWQEVLKRKLCYVTLRWNFISKHANIPMEYRIKGWKSLVKQGNAGHIKNSVVSDLFKTKFRVTKKFWEELLKQRLNTDEMYEIIRCAPEEYKKEVWERFLKIEANDCKPYLRMICRYCLARSSGWLVKFPENYKIKVWEEFLKRKPGNDEFILVTERTPEKYYRRKALGELKKKISGDKSLCIEILSTSIQKYYRYPLDQKIPTRGTPFKYIEEVLMQFLEQKPSNYELFLVIEKASSEYCKIKAWEKFLEQNPDGNDLNLVITFASEKYKTKAQEVLNKVLKKEIYI